MGLLATTALVAQACVIAEPPSDPVELPPMRPTILRSSVVPSSTAVLGRWPDKFIVPVELVDPRAPFVYTAFVDYNPVTGQGLAVGPLESPFDPQSSSTRGRVRTLEIPIADVPSPDRCHVVEVIVALEFATVLDSKGLHTPADPGGDSVTWFFSPSGAGDLAGCPVLDAGLAPISDGGPDAEAGFN